MLQGTALPSLVDGRLELGLAHRLGGGLVEAVAGALRSTLTWTTLPFSSMPSFNFTMPSMPMRFASGG